MSEQNISKATLVDESIVNKKEQAISAINELLVKEGIVKILYIDDKFNEDQQRDFFRGRMLFTKNKGNFPTDIDEFQNIDWNSPKEKFLSDIDIVWKKSDAKKLIHLISEHIGDEESSNIIPVLEIGEYLKDSIQLLTPEEWDKTNGKLFSELEDGKKYLCLFDYELKDFKGSNGEIDGLQLAKSIIESDKNTKACCGIFSHKYSEEEEDSIRQEYSKKYNLSPENFYTISKKRFAFDPKLSAFAEGIKNILSLSYIEDLKNKSLVIIKKSNIDSLEELKNLSPKTFNQIVQKASFKEGVWEINSLFRLYSIINDNASYNSLKDDNLRQDFESSISRIRLLDNVDTGYDFNSKNNIAIELRNKEIFYEEDILNKLNLPLTNGDIFQVGSQKFILLVQPCNLALRNDGKRSRDFNKGIIVPLLVQDKNKFKSTISSPLIYPGLDNSKVCAAIFPDYKTISLDILDLTVFNNDSKATIDMNISDVNSNLLLQSMWKIRYEKIHKSFLKKEKNYISYDSIKKHLNGKLKEEVDNLNLFFDRPNYMSEFKIGDHKIYNSTTRIFDFKTKRIKRYKSPFAADLLQNFMTYLSRNGFEVDFLEQ